MEAEVRHEVRRRVEALRKVVAVVSAIPAASEDDPEAVRALDARLQALYDAATEGLAATRKHWEV